MSRSRQLSALLLATKNKETKHYIHPKHKSETKHATTWSGTRFATCTQETEHKLSSYSP